MKVLDLQCAQSHGFEGWVGSEQDYASQLARGLGTGPMCGAKNMTLEPGLRDALNPGQQRLWDSLAPQGKIDLTAHVEFDSRAKKTTVDWYAYPRNDATSIGTIIEPVAFPYHLKLQSGAIVQNTAPQDISEIVGSALRRAGKILIHHKVSLEMATDLPMLELDAVLFEQALFNLLDNAAKYAAPDTTISIRAARGEGQIVLQILDEGSGIPPGELESVFDKFYRAQKGDHVRPGTGLGLAISRGFVEAMHGTITASNRADRSGAVLTIRLPIPTSDRALDTAA